MHQKTTYPVEKQIINEPAKKSSPSDIKVRIFQNVAAYLPYRYDTNTAIVKVTDRSLSRSSGDFIRFGQNSEMKAFSVREQVPIYGSFSNLHFRLLCQDSLRLRNAKIVDKK